MRDLFFRIKAVDQTAAAFARVRSGLKGLDGAFAGLNDRAARASSRLRSIGESLSAQTSQIRDAFSGSMAAYDASAQSAAKVEAAIRSTGGAAGYTADQLAAMAAGFQRTTQFDGDNILGDVTAQLLTFTRIAGEPFARAQAAVLDMSTLLGSDLKSSAILVGKALNDPVRGLTAMGRAGIQFSDAQKEPIRHLAETGQIARAQGLILDELATQFGGQAAASAQTGLGALDQLGNAWGDIQETVGESLAAFAVPLAGVLQSLADAFSGLPVPMQKFGVALAPVSTGHLGIGREA